MDAFFHTKLGFCMWDIPSLLLVIVMAAVLAGHLIRQKKREEDFSEED